MTTRLQKNPCTSGREIYNLVDLSLVIITIHLVCLNHVLDKRGKYFLPKNYHPLGCGGGVMESTISCLLSLQLLHTKFDKDWHKYF